MGARLVSASPPWIILHGAQWVAGHRLGIGNVKKNNGRRKADGRRKKVRRHAPPKVPVRAAPAAAALPALAHRTEPQGIVHASMRRHVDWPAIAILVAPLALMALLQSYRVAPSAHLEASPAPWHGDLSREAMPIFPEPARHLARADTERPLPEWHGKLGLEAMPLFPEPTNHAAVAPPSSAEVDGLPSETPPVVAASTETAETDGTDEALSFPDIAFAEPLPEHEPPPPPPIATLPPLLCVPEEAPRSAAISPSTNFGLALSAAAREQTKDFVIYNARYVSLAFPRGDTQPLYGVCTDVVVRAYRALGIDLQELIHASRLGRGDPSIDHRRVEVVRRFLARHGTSLAISEFAEDYRPGDIVTYHRPEGRISQYHIAIVTDRIAPSGRPLIAHNRGWGPQLEDALFVDRITGHYRLSREQVTAFERTRPPRVSERRRRTADVSSSMRR